MLVAAIAIMSIVAMLYAMTTSSKNIFARARDSVKSMSIDKLIYNDLLRDRIDECREILKGIKGDKIGDSEIVRKYLECIHNVFSRFGLRDIEVWCGNARCIILVSKNLDREIINELREIAEKYRSMKQIVIYEVPCGTISRCEEQISRTLFNKVINSSEFLRFLNESRIRVIYAYRLNNGKYVTIGPDSNTGAIIGIYYFDPFTTGFTDTLMKIINDEKLSGKRS